MNSGMRAQFLVTGNIVFFKDLGVCLEKAFRINLETCLHSGPVQLHL